MKANYCKQVRVFGELRGNGSRINDVNDFLKAFQPEDVEVQTDYNSSIDSIVITVIYKTEVPKSDQIKIS